MNQPPLQKIQLIAFSLLAALALAGCGSEEDGNLRRSDSPAQAAEHLADAFANANDRKKKNVNDAAAAIEKGEYRRALIAIETIKTEPEITYEQGLAVNDLMINLERELISGVDAGDPQAIAAYELLKRINRN